MINQIKMQFYASRKNGMWVFILLLTAFFTTVFTMATYSMKGQVINSELMQNLASLNYLDGSDMTLIDYFQRIICSDAVVMFTSMFAAIFAVMEFQNGFIKNIWHTVSDKKHLLFAKYVVLAFHIILSFVIVCLVVTICNQGVMKCELVGDIGGFIKVLLIQFFLQISFCSIVIALSLTVRKILVGVIISLIYVVIAKSAIYKVIDMILNKLSFIGDSFTIQDYLPYGNILKITTNSSSEDIVQALIVAFVFLIVASIISIVSLNKQDIC